MTNPTQRESGVRNPPSAVLLTWLITAANVAGLLCGSGSAFAEERRFVTGARQHLGVETRLSASVRAGDLDGDGDMDLVVANGRHWPQQNMVFLNQTGGKFNVARPLGVDQSTSYACEVADLDGDGDLDIAVGNDNAPCLVFLNDGTAQFNRHCNVGKPSSVRSLTIADIDADADMDLIITCRGRANRIYFNDGHAGFERSLTFGTRTDSTIDVAVADLNQDGRADLILANRDQQPNTILLAEAPSAAATSELRFRPPIVFGAAQSSRAIATADFDGDGNIDWVVGNIGSSNTVYFGDGKGGVARKVAIGEDTGQTYCIAVADLNGDHQPDIVAGNMEQSNSIVYNQQNGKQFVVQEFGGNQSATYGLCIGDFNGDGFPEIAVANSGQTNQVFLNQPANRSNK